MYYPYHSSLSSIPPANGAYGSNDSGYPPSSANQAHSPYATSPSMHDAGSGYSAPLSSNTPTADVGQYIMQEYEFAYTGTSYDTLSPQLSPTPCGHGSYSTGWHAGQPGLYAPMPMDRSTTQSYHDQPPSQNSTSQMMQGYGGGSQQPYTPQAQLSIYPGRLTLCEWDGGSCGVALDDITPAGIARHLRSYHFRGNWQARARGRCSWGTNCRGDDMNYESMGKHVAQVHLGSTKKQCPQCGGTFARNDALLRHLREHCDTV